MHCEYSSHCPDVKVCRLVSTVANTRWIELNPLSSDFEIGVSVVFSNVLGSNIMFVVSIDVLNFSREVPGTTQLQLTAINRSSIHISKR